MIVFKTFLKILNKNKFIVILYTIMLITFGATNMTANESSMTFTAEKPDMYIINNDNQNDITDNLVKYLTEKNEIIDIKNEEEAIDDAIFYRDVNYVVYIPENYGKDFLAGKNPEISVKTTGDYMGELANMMLERYMKVANSYQKTEKDTNVMIEKINSTLANEADVEITTKLDATGLERVNRYYNFASYSILACLVYVIALILSSFKEQKIQKRTTISSMNYKKFNIQLLLSNCIFSVTLWILYVVMSFILLGKTMQSMQGMIYIINTFIFTICATTIAFLVGTLVTNKNAINGIVNVIALGSAFLCGAFVPMEWLPDNVLKIAHVLPAYYFVKTNEVIKTMEVFNSETLRPVFINMGIILVFSMIFIIVTTRVAKSKREIG